jgi:transposase
MFGGKAPDAAAQAGIPVASRLIQRERWLASIRPERPSVPKCQCKLDRLANVHYSRIGRLG